MEKVAQKEILKKRKKKLFLENFKIEIFFLTFLFIVCYTKKPKVFSDF